MEKIERDEQITRGRRKWKGKGNFLLNLIKIGVDVHLANFVVIVDYYTEWLETYAEKLKGSNN